MAPQVGWSRSRRWLLETCARRFVLTYPDGLGGSSRPMAPTPRLRLKRLIDGVRRDLFEDRSEGHAWSNRLHRVVLERRMDAAGAALELDGVARRREAVMKCAEWVCSCVIRGWRITFLLGFEPTFHHRCVRWTISEGRSGRRHRPWWVQTTPGSWCCGEGAIEEPSTIWRPPSVGDGRLTSGHRR